jgi:general stress protein YciG
MREQEIIKKFLSEIGRKGGRAATGKAKVRGDSAYYSRLRKMGVRKQKKVK